MNNTAYNPLKKLLVMSIVLFAGTSAMAQQAAGSEMFGTTKPASMSTTPAVKQENANKATNPALSTATAKPGTNTKATATTRKQNAINASGATATPANGTTKQGNGAAATNGSATKGGASVQTKIARIDAMLAKPDLTEARRKSLIDAREALLKGQARPDKTNSY
jgi:hypothetical protein